MANLAPFPARLLLARFLDHYKTALAAGNRAVNGNQVSIASTMTTLMFWVVMPDQHPCAGAAAPFSTRPGVVPSGDPGARLRSDVREWHSCHGNGGVLRHRRSPCPC